MLITNRMIDQRRLSMNALRCITWACRKSVPAALTAGNALLVELAISIT